MDTTFLVEALWVLATRVSICELRRMARTFAIIFGIAWMRLMGL